MILLSASSPHPTSNYELHILISFQTVEEDWGNYLCNEKTDTHYCKAADQNDNSCLQSVLDTMGELHFSSVVFLSLITVND